MQHSVLIFLAFLALGWSPTRMENLGYNQHPQRNVKELRIGGIFTEDQYQLDTIQVSCLSKHDFELAKKERQNFFVYHITSKENCSC